MNILKLKYPRHVKQLINGPNLDLYIILIIHHSILSMKHVFVSVELELCMQGLTKIITAIYTKISFQKHFRIFIYITAHSFKEIFNALLILCTLQMARSKDKGLKNSLAFKNS